MKTHTLLSGVAILASGVMAAEPFLNEADTAIELAVGGTPIGALPDLDDMVGLPDFDWAARNFLPPQNYTYYRNGAAGEWSYRHNMEVFHQYRFRPRMMVDISNIEASLPTNILGYNFSAPFYISPCAQAGLAHPDGELNLMKAAGNEGILYVPALIASKSMEDISAARQDGQISFQQLYLDNNDTLTQLMLDRSKANGASAIVFTVDTNADGNRHRANRFGVGLGTASYRAVTWEFYKKLTAMTDLPIILKGISAVEDVKLAIEHNVPAIIISNHGGRQVDDSPSPIETALEIFSEDPSLFQQIEIWADGGVWYGTDVLKLLALGVKAVGLGRSFMLSNVFGQDGVERAIQLLKHEIAIDAANVGIPDLHEIGPQYVDWTPRWGLS